MSKESSLVDVIKRFDKAAHHHIRKMINILKIDLVVSQQIFSSWRKEFHCFTTFGSSILVSVGFDPNGRSNQQMKH